MEAETKDELSESALTRKLIPYAGKFAYHTFVLFAVATGIYIGYSILGGLDIWPLWISTIVNAVCAYLLFTPLHEATHQNIKGKHGSLNWLEDVIAWSSSLSLLALFPLFKYLHITHNRQTNHAQARYDYYSGKSKHAPDTSSLLWHTLLSLRSCTEGAGTQVAKERGTYRVLVYELLEET